MEEQGLIDSEWLAAAVEGGNSRAARVFLRSLSALLFGVAADDFPTYLVVLTLLRVVAVLASYFPARRAARVEPLVALRQD